MLHVFDSPHVRGAGPRPRQLPQFVPVKGFNHNPAIVAAKFPIEGGNPGRVQYGAMYRNGTCSCSEFARHRRCAHSMAWGAMVEAASKRYLTYGHNYETLKAWLVQEFDVDEEIAGVVADEGVSILYENAYGHIESYR